MGSTPAALIFWIWMLVDCATKEPSEGNDKIVWILIILLTNLLGAIIYFVARRPKRLYESGYRSTPTMKGPAVAIVKAATLVLSLVIGGFLLYPLLDTESSEEAFIRIHAEGAFSGLVSIMNSTSHTEAYMLRLRGENVPSELSHGYRIAVRAPLRNGFCGRTSVYGGGYAYFWRDSDEEVIYGLLTTA